jgi:hypothetical protein
MERNDFGEHKFFVNHQADTKAKSAGRTNIIICSVALLSNETTRYGDGRLRCGSFTAPSCWSRWWDLGTKIPLPAILRNAKRSFAIQLRTE